MGHYGGKYDVESGATLADGTTVLPIGLNTSSSTDPDGLTIVTDDGGKKWVQLDAGIWQINYSGLFELPSATAAQLSTDVAVRNSAGAGVGQGAADHLSLSASDSEQFAAGSITLLLEDVTLVGVIANVSTSDADKIKFNRLTLSFLGVNDDA
jgi:hypothetical protein